MNGFFVTDGVIVEHHKGPKDLDFKPTVWAQLTHLSLLRPFLFFRRDGRRFAGTSIARPRAVIDRPYNPHPRRYT